MTDEYTSKWESRWQADNTPWDLGQPTNALVELFKHDIPCHESSLKTALVPGCGSGYDVGFIAQQPGWSATGLDISETAVQVARRVKSYTLSAFIMQKNDGIPKCHFSSGDFFTWTGQYDLIFDHTFLCALLPSMRLDWAKQMAKLLKPGGMLIAYMYPIATHTDGPPFAVTPELYKDLLGQDFDLEFIRDISVKMERRINNTADEKISKWIRK